MPVLEMQAGGSAKGPASLKGRTTMRFLYVALISLGLLAPAASHAASAKEQCDNCETFRKGVSRKIIPTDNIVCIYFTQPSEGDVLLRIDLKDGSVRPYTKKRAGKTDRICVGRHWVQNASSMLICNSENHALYAAEHIEQVAKKAATSKEGEACLHGKARCKTMGYKSRD